MMKLTLLITFLLSIWGSNFTYAALTEADKAATIAGQNKLTNPGAELGKAGVTASSGTFTTVTAAANVLSGNAAFSWDASASGQTLTWNNVSVTSGGGLSNKSITASCAFKAASGTATHTLEIYDGTNILASTTITSTTGSFSRSSVSVVAPDSGTIKMRLQAHADEPVLYADDCYFGLAENYKTSQLSQAVEYGTLIWAGGDSSCKWSFAGNWPQDAAAQSTCTAAVVTGNASAPATKIPAVVFSTLPAGNYEVVACGRFIAAAGNTDSLWRIYDGTNYSGVLSQWGSTAGTGFYGGGCMAGRFSYTTAQSNITFKIRGGDTSGGGTTSVLDNRNANQELSFWVYRFPSTNETVYTPDKVANSWSGYSVCSGGDYAVTSTSYASFAGTTCSVTESTNSNFGTVTGSTTVPQITFTPVRAGRYHVCAKAVAYSATSGSDASLQLWDGTTTIHKADWRIPASNNRLQVPVCGIYNATSTSSVTLSLRGLISSGTLDLGKSSQDGAVYWEIFQIDQQLPMPLLVNSVVNPRTGATNICSGKVTNGGTATITSDGSCATVTRNGTGDVTVNFASGTYSAAPNCTVSYVMANSNRLAYIASVTSSAMSVGSITVTTGTVTDVDFSFICVGAK